MNAYAKRDELLKKMGFACYPDYLGSSLWSSIRDRVMSRDKYKCRGCGEEGREVHHHSYEESTMKGKTIAFLFTLCRGCHRKIEFNEKGFKYTFKRTRDNLLGILKPIPAKKPPPPKQKTEAEQSQEATIRKRKIAERLQRTAARSAEEHAIFKFWMNTAVDYRRLTRRARREFRDSISLDELRLLEKAVLTLEHEELRKTLLPRKERKQIKSAKANQKHIAKNNWFNTLPTPNRNTNPSSPLRKFVDLSTRIR